MLLRCDRVVTAISIMSDVAFNGGRGRVMSANDIAERLGLARRGIEPILQALSRAGLLGSTRGPNGGYYLGRSSRDLTLAEIAAAVTEQEEPSRRNSSNVQDLVVLPYWKELNALCSDQLSKVTLLDLSRRAISAGLQRPVTDPLNFVI